jgi:amino-acid N-acetyltransferase
MSTQSAATVSIRRATPTDAGAIESLVREAGLVLAGAREHVGSFLIAELGGRPVGAIGLELRGTSALLRSAVVAPDARGGGIGGALFDAVVELARAQGVETLYLLTTGAESYWSRRGFAVVAREAVPEPVRQSAEFAGACPATAAAMRRAV